MADLPHLYTDFAQWWPILSSPADYANEAAWYGQILVESCQPAPVTLLELGSGGGNNASHLKAHFQMTLVDLAPGMVAVSQALNPECEHLHGDMRTVRLGRLFDAVFIHDAIEYMTTEDDLRQAMETAYCHCRPGGVVLFAPDCVVETFLPSTRHGGHDAPDGRGLRYLEWTWDPDPDDRQYTVDFAYLLRDVHGRVHTEHDRHIFGLFSRQDWLRLMTATGFMPRIYTSSHPDFDEGGGEVFVGLKP